MTGHLPSLSLFDPPDAAEGTLDPLGLGQLATRVAEMLVPDFRERVRRPRFFTALTLGAAVLGPARWQGGAYEESIDGPRYLGWERLLVESYARTERADDTEGFKGVPGIAKARQAVAQDARLSSRLYLKNAAAVGWWVAYKGISAEIGLVDEQGNLQEVGRELLRAWATAIGEPELARADRDPARFSELDAALTPLLGERGQQWKPQSTWKFLAEALHPRKLSRGEAKRTSCCVPCVSAVAVTCDRLL